MKVIRAIAHQLHKKAKTTGAEADPSDEAIENSVELNELVSDLLETFNSKTAQRTGIFEEDSEVQYPFGPGLTRYLGDGDFVKFTSKALEQLEMLIKDVYQAAGGYIFFVHYQVSAGEFFVVAKLNDATGKVFTKDRKRVVSNFHLSLDKLHHVGRVNIEAWRAGANKYLTFVNARENGGSSNYFVTFLGCSVATKPRVESGKLVAVVEAFCADQLMDEGEEIGFKQSVFEHVKSIGKGQTVSLAILANKVWPEKPEEFIEYVNQHSDAPSDDFHADIPTLKSLVGYRVNVPGLRMWMTSEFKKNHHVRFNDADELVISDAAGFRDSLE